MRISPETGSPPFSCPLAPPPQPARTSDSAATRPATTDHFVLVRPVLLNPYTPFVNGTHLLGPTSGRPDGRGSIYALCYTRVRSKLNLRFMRLWALRPRVPSMQALVA